MNVMGGALKLACYPRPPVDRPTVHLSEHT
jgi:hypothetical protein